MIIEEPTTKFDIFNDYIKKHTFKTNITKTKFLDKAGRTIGVSGNHGYWRLFKYDEYGNRVYTMNSEGDWEKRKYLNGSIIQFTNSLGTHWVKK